MIPASATKIDQAPLLALAARIVLASAMGLRENVLFPYTWVAAKALPHLTEHAASFKDYPPIPPGTLDPYEPPS